MRRRGALIGVGARSKPTHRCTCSAPGSECAGELSNNVGRNLPADTTPIEGGMCALVAPACREVDRAVTHRMVESTHEPYHFERCMAERHSATEAEPVPPCRLRLHVGTHGGHQTHGLHGRLVDGQRMVEDDADAAPAR